MLKIEVKDASIHEETIKPSAKPGAKQFTPFNKRTQRAYVHLFDQNGNPQPYPVSVKLTLDEGQEAYPIGTYQLAETSFYTDRNQNLAIGRPRLTPLKQSTVRT